MVYSPTTWDAATALTVARLNNLETQYDEAMTLFTGHNHDSVHFTKSEMDARFWHSGNDGPNSGMDADILYYAGGNKHAADFSGIGAPTGLVVLWPEAVAPPGWHICDGNDGTVNLKDRFVVGAGAGSNYGVGNTGGATSRTPSAASVTIGGCTLTVAQIKHSHTLSDRQPSGAGGYNTVSTDSSQVWTNSAVTVQTGYAGGGGSHNHPGSFSGNSFDNRPPYYALVYIQKV